MMIPTAMPDGTFFSSVMGLTMLFCATWFITHTSIFNSPAHVTPSPEYPVWHVQKNDPLVLVQLESL